MKRSITAALLILIAMVVPSLGAGGSNAVNMAPVVMTGADLAAISGDGIDKIRVYAKKGGAFAPIPFQIDERIAKRKNAPRYVYPPEADSNPAFDADDELVFMARDAGEKASGAEPALGQIKTIEVAVSDAAGAVSYAYVLTFAEPPARSTEDYVSWNAALNTVDAEGYSVGYSPEDPLFFDTLSVPTTNGGTGADFVDGLKMRANGRIIVQLFVYDIDNSDYLNKPRGVIDGPVRVLRKIKVDFSGAVFRVHHDVVDAKYYPEWFEVVAPVRMGVRGPTVTYQADARFTLDLNASGKGMSFVNARNGDGVKIDGTLDDAEKKMNYGPARWFAVYGAQGNVVVRLDQAKGSKLRQDLYYMDEEVRADSPEGETGMVGNAGFNVLSLNRAGKKNKHFTLRFYFPAAFDPASTPASVMSLVDAPASVKVAERVVAAPAQAGPMVESTRWRESDPRPSYMPPAIAERTRGYLPQLLIDPNLGYGSGFQVVERKTFGTKLSSDFLFLISHRAYQFYRLEEIVKDVGGIDEFTLYVEYLLHPNRYFYGIGNDQTPEQLTVYKHERYQGYLRMEKYLTKSFMIGLETGFMHNDIGHGKLFSGDEPSIEDKFGGDFEIKNGRFGPEVYGTQGGWTNWIRADFAIDTRDDKLYTRSGTFDILRLEYVPKWLGSDFEYFKYRLDARFYLGGDGLNPDKEMPRNFWLRLVKGPQVDRVFAMRFVVQRVEAEKFNFGGRDILKVPFTSLSYFGDANSSRGHYWAQWIDNDVTFAMFELRWHLWKIIDATVFYDIGRVWEDLYDGEEWQDISGEDLHKSWGAGLRFNMVPSMMMRVDYGFSSENPGGLLYIEGWHTF